MTKVTIYSTTTCPYCQMEKNYLQSNGVAFDEVLVDKEPDRIMDVLETCGSMGVPCTHVVTDNYTEERILGFDKPRLDSALGLAA